VTDIFVSYAAEDRERIRPLVELLEKEAWSVWWDREIHAGPRFDQIIEEAIERASCVVVVWSQYSVQSDWVRTEASEGLERGILVPLRIDNVRPPLVFRRSQTADLIGFPENRAGLDMLLSGIRETIQRPDQAASGIDETQLAVKPGERTQESSRSFRQLTIGSVSVVSAAIAVWVWWVFFGGPSDLDSNRSSDVSTIGSAPSMDVNKGPAVMTRGSKPSIAVLPFANLSSDPEQDFFSEGMADEVLNRLARIPDLKVISRSSSFSFKGRNADVATIAERLGVSYLIEGSVRKVGERVRISAQLVDAKNDEQLWSESFDRDLRDVFEIQTQIAARIASQLNVTLFDYAAMVEEIDPAAYSAFLQAHHLLSMAGTDEEVLRAEQLLNEALRIEPDYVRAILEFGRVAERKEEHGMVPEGEGLRLSKKMVRRALALNPDDAQANGWLAWQYMAYDHDLTAGAPYLERALLLDPLNLNVLRPTVGMLLFFGRIDDATRVAEFVVERDPLCVVCLSNLADTYEMQGRLDDAESVLRRGLLLNSTLITGLARIRLKQQRPEEVIQLAEQMPDDWYRVFFRALAHYDLGNDQAFKAEFASLQGRWPERRLTIAVVYAYIGDVDQAFAEITEAVEQDSEWRRSFYYGMTAVSLDELLHNDPRWEAFLRRHGISQEQLDRIPFDPALPI